MLKFESKVHHLNIESIFVFDSIVIIKVLFDHLYHLHQVMKNKNRLLINEVVFYTHNYRNNKKQKISKNIKNRKLDVD